MPRNSRRPVVDAGGENDVLAAAARLRELHSGLGRAFAARGGGKVAADAWRNAAAAFNEAVQAFYAPYEAVKRGIKAGSSDSIEQAVQFLLADPWCFRSGYLKAELMHALANTDLPARALGPLREVVLTRLKHPQPGLMRPTVQLAARVWDSRLKTAVRALADGGTDRDVQAARRVIEGVEHKRRTIAGVARRAD